MLKQSVDKIASSAIRFDLCVSRGQKYSNLVVGRRVAWKDVLLVTASLTMTQEKKNTRGLFIPEVNRDGKVLFPKFINCS